MQNYPDCQRLVGAVVQIHRENQAIRTGVIDDAMPDSSLLLLAADGVHQRRMYEAAENYKAWVQPQPLEGEAAYRMTYHRLCT